jgi:hypothetical protein
MGTLNVSTVVTNNISDGTTTINVSDTEKGTAKAYVLFAGASPGTLTNSYNVTSITDNGLGDFTVNFNNPLENNLYVVSMATESSALSFTLQGNNANLSNRGTTEYRFKCIYHNPTSGVAINLDGGYHNLVFY